MAQKSVDAVVDRKGYHYRGQAIPKGRVVRMSEAQYAETQQEIPSFFRKARAEEVTAATVVIDLASIEAPTPENVAAAEAADAAGGPARSTKK